MGTGAGRTKGIAIAACLAFVEERFGKASRAELCSARVQEAIGLPLDSISVASWYPTAGYVRLLKWIADRFLDADPRRCAEIGAFAVGRDFRGVYRAFLTGMRPDFLLRMAHGIWSHYQDSGRFRVLEQSRSHCVIEIDDYSDPSPHQWYATIGGTVQGLELMGAREVSFEVLSGIGDAGSRLSYRCDWR